MLSVLKRLWKRKELWIDGLSLLIGFCMLPALIVFSTTGSRHSMYCVIIFGGILNLLNGCKIYGQKGKKNIGLSMLMLGALILILCLVLIVNSTSA